MPTALQPAHSSHTSQPSSAVSRQIIGLDLIRFIASLLVVSYHLTYWNGVGPTIFSPNHRYAWLTAFVRIGWIGVPIFFVLSGFVIAYSAENARPFDFLKNRLLRLYPGAWICSTITMLAFVMIAPKEPFIRPWIKAMILWPLPPYLDPSYWTLGIEMTFYLLIFALLSLGWFRHLGAVMAVVAVLNALCMAYPYALRYSLIPVTRHSLALRDHLVTRGSDLLLLHHGALFSIGVLLWLCLLQRATVFRVSILAFCFVPALLSIQDEGVIASHITPYVFSPIPAIALWFAFLVAIVLSVKRNRTFSQRAGTKGAKIIRTLGLMSYPIYLLHQRAGRLVIANLHGHIPDLLSGCLVVLTVLCLSFLIVKYLEKPLQTRLRAMLHGPPKTASVPVSTLP